MSAGDRWKLPDGREALEVENDEPGWLRVMPIRENWPFPLPPVEIERKLCKRMPSRYLHGQVQQEEEARW